MIARIRRLLEARRHRSVELAARRSSTHLTPGYEARRRREIAKAQAMFSGEMG